MDREKLGQFYDEAMDLCAELEGVFERMGSEPEDRDLVHRAFRLAHSLKSEAQLVGAEEPAAIAEELEGVLHQIREGSLAVDGSSLGLLVPTTEALRERLGAIAPQRPAEEHPAAEGGSAGGAPSFRAERYRSTSLPAFSDFERQLIGEALARGERLLRLDCEIEESAPLKYPKAYLVVNNLEMVTNVIRSVPSLETKDDEAFSRFSVYFTSAAEQETIREAIDVDQVAAAAIEVIPPRVLQAAGEVPPPAPPAPRPRRGPSSVRIDNGRLDEIAREIAGLADAAEALAREAGPDAPRLRTSLRRLSGRVKQLEELVHRTRKVAVGEELRHLPWLVRDLSARLGKRVRLVTSGDATGVDRRLASMLSEPLIHLVRNAVDHGIESPEERVAAGKPAEGLIVVATVERGDEVLVQVGDDGRGVSLGDVERRARELGMETADQVGGRRRHARGVLDLLVRPGFSTRSEATAVSGRGVGLDVIQQKVRQTLGGELRLGMQEGEGSLFTISIPGASTMMSLLLVRCAQRTVGIALREIGAVEEAASSAFANDGDGLGTYRGLALYGGEGRVRPAALTKESYQVITVRRARRAVAFLCDELLYERDLPERALSLSDAPKGELLVRAAVAGEPCDFLYLDLSRRGPADAE